MFFDSHPWIESDCEDYLSVDGGEFSLNFFPWLNFFQETPTFNINHCWDFYAYIFGFQLG
jgi:hypothetical protein